MTDLTALRAALRDAEAAFVAAATEAQNAQRQGLVDTSYKTLTAWAAAQERFYAAVTQRDRAKAAVAAAERESAA